MYEFVGIKGQKGKMSGSKGNVILLSDLYEVLEPGIIRFIYAKARPNKELKIDSASVCSTSTTSSTRSSASTSALSTPRTQRKRRS